MEPVMLLILIALGLLFLCFLVPVAEAVVAVVRERIAKTVPALTGLARQAFRWVVRLLTEDGRLSPAETIAQVAGAVVLMAAGLVFAVTDLAVTLATLAPLIGVEFQPPQGLFSTFDQLLGVSLVLLAVVFGMTLSDLKGWTMSTRFALITEGRLGAFFLAAVCFVLSLLVGLALAGYRAEALKTDGGAEAAAATLMWLHTLPTFILLGLAALLFIGVAVTLMHTEAFCSAVVALLVTTGGVGCVSLTLLLRGLDLLLEVAVTGMSTTPGALTTFTTAGQAGMGRVWHRLGTARERLAEKLGRLVQPRPLHGLGSAPHMAAELRRPSALPEVFNGQHGTPSPSPAGTGQA